MKINHKCKVIRILDEYRIVINAGTQDGVTPKYHFEIVGSFDKIYDPENHKLLGIIPGIKAKVFPVTIQENICICKNKDSEPSSPYSLFMLSVEEQLALSRNISTTPAKLKVDKSQISNPEIYEPIRIGDTVIMYDDQNIQCSDINIKEIKDSENTK